MKLAILLFILTFSFAFTITESVDAILLKKNPDALWNDSKSIFVGNVVDSTTISQSNTMGDSLELEEYSVSVERYFKNHLGMKTINIQQPVKNGKTLNSFDVGDRVLFYLDETWGKDTYAPESCLINSDCTAGQMAQIVPMNQKAITPNADIVLGIAMVGGIVVTSGIAIWRKRKLKSDAKPQKN